MKIISLNTWGGRAGSEGLLDFFRHYNNKVEVFCLQEIWSAPYEHLEGTVIGGRVAKHQNIMVYGLQEITAVLQDYVPYFRPHHLDNYGLLTLVHKDVVVVEEGEEFVHKEKGYIPEGDVGHHARNVQYLSLEKEGTQVHVMNFHGLWNGKGKGDAEERIQQSQKIISLLKRFQGDVILCGDFNLLPDTQSIKILEESGLKNLIKEYKVTSTRTKYYDKSEKFADYIFVSEGVRVKEFRVLPDEVSDHAPLYIEV